MKETGAPNNGKTPALSKDEQIDASVGDSFPASDPPSHTPVTGVTCGKTRSVGAAGGPGPSPESMSAEEQPAPPFPPQQQRKPGLESELRPRPRYSAKSYKGAGKLLQRTALITGGDSGIGRAVAVLFAREGANVALTFLPQESTDAQETAEAVQDEGRQVLQLPGNIEDPHFCRSAVAQTIHNFGRLDILVNNAAYQQHCDRIEDLSEAQWDRTFKTNIYGYFRMVQAALPHLQPGSSIVNTGSITGLEGSANLLDYSATKGAIHAFTKSLAQSLMSRGVRVNCVAPGPVWTPLNPADGPVERVAHFGEKTPMGRPAQPEEIAPAYVFFASAADSSYITGEVLTLLGGATRAA